MAGVPVHVGPDAVEVMSPGSATETSAEAPLTTLDTIIKQVLPSTLVPRSLRAVFRTEQPPGAGGYLESSTRLRHAFRFGSLLHRFLR